LDCRPFEDYGFCHLDGAIHVDVESTLTSAAEAGHDPAMGGRSPLPDSQAWGKRLCSWGVRPDSLVVAYDGASGAEGAARAWWMLTASGIRSAILDGGWDAAMKARLAISEETPVTGHSEVAFTKWLLPTVDIETVDRLRQASDWALLDSRASDRWRGEAEPFDPLPGRIPGSRNVCFRDNLLGGFFKKPEDLRKMYLEVLGPVSPAHVVASCGSGMTACHTLLALHLAGLKGASLYVGSYSEWCRNKPVAVGI
jgi:thiosulfate/3-mercaptopyruvate sulfurtransferase